MKKGKNTHTQEEEGIISCKEKTHLAKYKLQAGLREEKDFFLLCIIVKKYGCQQ